MIDRCEVLEALRLQPLEAEIFHVKNMYKDLINRPSAPADADIVRQSIENADSIVRKFKRVTDELTARMEAMETAPPAPVAAVATWVLFTPAFAALVATWFYIKRLANEVAKLTTKLDSAVATMNERVSNVETTAAKHTTSLEPPTEWPSPPTRLYLDSTAKQVTRASDKKPVAPAAADKTAANKATAFNNLSANVERRVNPKGGL